MTRVTLPLPHDGALRLGVVADTHSAPHPAAGAQLAALAPAAILHAGDIGALSVLDELASATRTQVIAVRGNIDGHAEEIPDDRIVDIVAADNPDAALLRIFLTHIAVNGPKLRADVARRADAADASLVICGHSHVPLVATDRGMTIFNPGSIGPRRFDLPIVFGTIDISPQGVRFTHHDCETGAPWKPAKKSIRPS